MATCVDVASADYPTRRDDIPIKPLEGQSLVTAFEDQPIDRWLFWEHEGNRAVRDGQWKLVAKGKMADRSQPVNWELYDLSVDRVEQNDLASQQPERVRKMADQWQKYAERCDVYPCPQPKPKAKQKEAKKKK